MAKKISAIVSLSLIAILIIATLIMSNVKCNYSIRCNDPDYITVTYGRSSSSPYLVTEEQQKKIVSMISNASKDKGLEAIFDGKLNDKAEVVTDSVNSTKNIDKNSKCYYVSYVYNNPQLLKVGNSNFKDANGKDYYYRELVFEVSETEGEKECRVYIIPEYKPNSADEYEGSGYSKYYRLNANFANLYSYLVDSNIK